MGKFIENMLWWLFLSGATLIFGDLIGVLSVWELGVFVFFLGTAAMALRHWRDFEKCRAMLSTKDGMAKHNAIALPQGLIADAHQNPGAGIHIAKLLLKVKNLNEAHDIWDIFMDAFSQRNKASAYAAYAHALVRFDCCLDASEILGEVYQEGVPQAEMEAAMDRFYYPEDDASLR